MKIYHSGGRETDNLGVLGVSRIEFGDKVDELGRDEAEVFVDALLRARRFINERAEAAQKQVLRERRPPYYEIFRLAADKHRQILAITDAVRDQQNAGQPIVIEGANAEEAHHALMLGIDLRAADPSAKASLAGMLAMMVYEPAVGPAPDA